MSAAEAREQQPPPAGRRGVDRTNELLLELIHLQLRFERQIMSDIDTIKAHQADLSQALADTSAKVDTLLAQNDALLTLTDSIAASLAAAGSAGQIPPDVLSALLTQIDTDKTTALAIGTKVDAEGAKVAAALTADAPATPTPPAPDPDPASTDGSGTTTGDGSGAPNGTEIQ